MSEVLNEQQIKVVKNGESEAPFSHPYTRYRKVGIYVDIESKEALFSSLDKYDARCGWPSFTKPIHEDAVYTKYDFSKGLVRLEVRSRRTQNHLGHLFDDGPRDKGGLRYCINGTALLFIPIEEMEEKGYKALKDELFKTSNT